MADFYPAIVTIAILAAVLVTIVYIVTNPYIVVPAILLVGFLTWRGYKRRRI